MKRLWWMNTGISKWWCILPIKRNDEEKQIHADAEIMALVAW